jgi:hypothetical protein
MLLVLMGCLLLVVKHHGRHALLVATRRPIKARVGALLMSLTVHASRGVALRALRRSLGRRSRFGVDVEERFQPQVVRGRAKMRRLRIGKGQQRLPVTICHLMGTGRRRKMSRQAWRASRVRRVRRVQIQEKAGSPRGMVGSRGDRGSRRQGWHGTQQELLRRAWMQSAAGLPRRVSSDQRARAMQALKVDEQ